MLELLPVFIAAAAWFAAVVWGVWFYVTYLNNNSDWY